MISRNVLNASLALSWCFNEESAPATERILRSFIDGSTACVPYLWMWEINNTLCLAERSNRLTKSERLEKINLLLNLRIDFDETAHQQCAGSTTHIALEHRLSVYDGAYMEMAIRLTLPLGSLDKELRAAARCAGVLLLPEAI